MSNVDRRPDLEAWTSHLSEPFRGRPVIVAFKVLAGMTHDVARLEQWGALRPLLIARGTGTGPLPSPDDADIWIIPLDPAPSLSEEVREVHRLIASPPAELVRRVEDFDPDRRAVWWLAPFAGHGSLLGRDVMGGRPDEWARLEDKLLCDEIWDAAGVTRSPIQIVSAVRAELAEATKAIGGPDGAVWSGDAREGVNGGGDFVRWVRSDADVESMTPYFAAHCDRVRVMPFLEGVPCSIHGFALADGVAAFRPVELVMLRRPAGNRFILGGMSTWWDSSDADREQMRDLVRRVGAILVDRVGYRGGFGIDGVMTRDGFRPTELNPRFTGGLMTLARSMPDVPLELLQMCAVAGRDPRVNAATLERLVVDAADAARFANALGLSDRAWEGETDEVDLAWQDGRFTVASDPLARVGSMAAGPAVTKGTFVRFTPSDDLMRPGMRLAPLHLKALRFADQHWDRDFGELEIAPDVR
jgi:predicted ATP-grasp superfamily ATP-dependent carboligase